MSGAKKLIIVTMTLFVLFCAYWALGRNIMIKTISSEMSDLQADGFKVVHKGLSIGGFPLKFRVRLAELDIMSARDTQKPWSLKADDWRMEALSLNPLKWKAVHRGEARIDMRGPKGERWLFDARPFNIDVTARAGLNGKLKKFDIIAAQLKTQAVIGTLPPIIAIDEAHLIAAPQDADIQYDISLENIFLETQALKNFQTIFGPRIESLTGTAIAIDLPSLDNEAIKAWQKTGRITGENWELSWGGTLFQGGFDLTQSDIGLSGTIRIEVDNINGLITRLEEATVFSSGQARNAKLAAILLPINQNGRQEITLTLRDGFLTLFGQRVFEF